MQDTCHNIGLCSNFDRKTYSFGQHKSIWNGKTMPKAVLLPHAHSLIQNCLSQVMKGRYTLPKKRQQLSLVGKQSFPQYRDVIQSHRSIR